MSNLLEDLNVSLEETDVILQKLDQVQGRLEPVRWGGQHRRGGRQGAPTRMASWAQCRSGSGGRNDSPTPSCRLLCSRRSATPRWLDSNCGANAYKDSEDEPTPRARPTNDGVDMVQAFKDRVVSQGSSPRRGRGDGRNRAQRRRRRLGGSKPSA